MNKGLKILAVNVSDISGGAARAAYRIHNAVRSLGVNSKMLVKSKGTEDDNVLTILDFDKKNIFSPVFRFVQHKIKNKLQQARWRKYPDKEDVFLSDLRSTSLHGALQKIDYDILHLHWINLRFLDLNDLKRVKKPIVWTLHDCWPFTGVCHYFYDCERYKTSCGTCPFLQSGNNNDLSHKIWKRKKKVYSSLNLHIVTPSRWLAEAASQSSLFSKFPVTVIPNAIDTDVFLPGNRMEACAVLGLDCNKKYILYGAMNAVKDKNKGFDKLLDAFMFLEQQLNTNGVELLIVGADKPIEELQTKIPIRYLGVLNADTRMVFAYQVADVMVVPSLSENLSNTIMESLSCGTPVVAFNIGGNSDMIDHKQNGYLVQNLNSTLFANGIKWCMENNFDDKLSINARKKVLENYSINVVGKMYQKIYDIVQ